MKSTWDQRYDRTDYYYGTAPNTFLENQAQRLPPKAKVLCLAEGEGRNAVFLATKGFQVTAVDSSKVGLAKLQKLAQQNKVHIETICDDLQTFSLGENKWDGIISIWCHLPKALRSKLHSQINDALKNDGYFILEAYTPEQLQYKTGGPQDPEMMPTSEILESELSGLKIISNMEIKRAITEGVGHEGMSAVVQLVAQKA